MSQAPNPSILIGLPVETRLSILDYLIPRGADNRQTITMSLVDGLRHPGPDNIHIHDVYPSRQSLRRYLKGIGMVNRQLHADAMVLLYDRTFIIKIGKDPKCSWPQCVADHAANWTIPMQWQVLLPGFDIARVKEMRIRAVSSGNNVTWASIQWRLESFCHILGRHLGEQGLKKLVVDIADMHESPPEWSVWQIGPWGPVSVLDPPKATVEDVVRLLHPVWSCLSNVKACEVIVPEWAGRDPWAVDAANETKEVIGLTWKERYEIVENSSIQDTASPCDGCQWNDTHNPDGANEQEGSESADVGTDNTAYNNNECKPEQIETEEEETNPTNLTDDGSETDDWPRYNPNDEEEPEDLWAKRRDEEWDDFYLLPPPPRYVLEYQLRDSVWIFGEEPQVESSEVDWGW